MQRGQGQIRGSAHPSVEVLCAGIICSTFCDLAFAPSTQVPQKWQLAFGLFVFYCL